MDNMNIRTINIKKCFNLKVLIINITIYDKLV